MHGQMIALHMHSSTREQKKNHTFIQVPQVRYIRYPKNDFEQWLTSDLSLIDMSTEGIRYRLG